MFEIVHYLNERGKPVFLEWLAGVRDKLAKSRILKRVERLQLGNFGDCKFVGNNVWELRIDHGPGYRVYYSIVDKKIVLLLCGGDKSTQSKDIEKAKSYLENYKGNDA